MDSNKDATENLGSSRCSAAIDLIVAERERQITQEGFVAKFHGFSIVGLPPFPCGFFRHSNDPIGDRQREF